MTTDPLGLIAGSALGVHLSGDGADAGVLSAVADAVAVCLFDDAGTETRVPLARDDAGVWRGHLPGVRAGDRYGLRVSGPWDPANGLRCNPSKLLLDPYAQAVDGTVTWGPQVLGNVLADPNARDDTDSAPYVPRSVVTGFSAPPPRLATPVPWSDTVIYELHVKGFTHGHPGVPEHLRGTYAGLASPAAIDHLVSLGVTSVELMPVHQFLHSGTLLDRGLRNYWGYDSIGFFAPHAEYSSSGTRGEQVAEFQAMVAALHAAGLEVILDVVFNHTIEGNENGPTLSFRGLDNAGYYRLVAGAPRYYYDTTGTGNTLDLARPAALRLVLDSLRHWVVAMGVDGFRFDLASSLARDDGGGWDAFSSFLDAIGQDPLLSAVKMIAEPWDTGPDGYDVGRFPAGWSEWNGPYRDDVRDTWRGVDGTIPHLATRLAGSADYFATRGPRASVNFVSCHDGFTLRDLTSYDTKHNDANGEGNQDGTNDNRSWNCGVEGETTDPGIAALRARQQRNLLTTLLLSDGVPMLAHGDELGRTQQGNNNAYCQDNAVSWIDWADAATHSDLTAFTTGLIALRRDRPVLRSRRFPTGTAPVDGGVEISWLRPDGQPMADADWATAYVKSLGAHLAGGGDPSELFLAFNTFWQPVTFTLPGTGWTGVLDTTTASPPGADPVPAGATVDVGPRTIVVLTRPASSQPSPSATASAVSSVPDPPRPSFFRRALKRSLGRPQQRTPDRPT